MNAKEQMKERVRVEMADHFAKQKKLAKQNRKNKLRGHLNDRLDDDIERRTRLDEVVGQCSYDPEYTSFGIR